MKILVVDDSEENIEILNEFLGNDYDVLSALDGEFALEIAVNDKPDLILLDIMMPGIDGFEVCRQLKDNDITQHIPVIFITAKAEENSIEEAYDAGGSDYITKPFKPKELLAKIKREEKLYNLINELIESRDKLKFLASVDSLTQLYNRRYFMKASEHILSLATRSKTDTSVFMIDIDKFKIINDTYGHSIGDEVLIFISKLFIKNTRNSDIVCRWGGEEFIILLPNTNIDGAVIIAEKIRTVVQNSVFHYADKKTLTFTISIGVSQVNPDEVNTLTDSINRSDKALYQAKESGRNKVVRN